MTVDLEGVLFGKRPAQSSGMPGVPHGDELRRVLGMPLRDPDAIAPKLVGYMTQRLKTPSGTMTLRPLQALALVEAHDYRGMLGLLPVGEGKAQPNSEPVLLERGWTPIGDVVVGDRIYGSDGQLHDVFGVFPQGPRPVYEIQFSGGVKVRSDIEHLWTFDVASEKTRKTMSLRGWLDREPIYRHTARHRVSRLFLPMLSAPIERPEVELPLDPYTLGALLGDGGMTTGTVSFTSMDDDIVASLKLPEGVIVKRKNSQNAGKATEYNLVKASGRAGGPTPNPLTTALRSLGLIGCKSGDKFVPEIYMRGSSAQRLEILRGLLDSDGEVARARPMFSSKSVRMAEQVAELAESLGGTASIEYRHNHVRVGLQMPAEVVPFRCSRRLSLYMPRLERRQRGVYRTVQAIEYVGEEPCTCISVSTPDRLYVTKRHVLTHNTLLSYLLPTVVGVRKAVLLVPASLVEKTHDEFAELAPHWQIDESIEFTVLSYEMVSTHPELLTELDPDCLICDEVHRVRDPQTTTTKRVRRYVLTRAKEGRKVVFCGLSGTIAARSFKDWWHIQQWALPDAVQPLPYSHPMLLAWCDALDEKLTARRPVGALSEFCPEDPTPAGIRTAFGERLRRTPGIISSKGGEVAASIQFSVVLHNVPSITETAKTMRKLWATPDEEFDEAADLWRHAREIGNGFYYKWETPAPPEWLEARSEFNAFVRGKLKRSRTLDGMKQVKEAHADNPAVQRWVQIEHTFEPVTVPVWFCYDVVEAAAGWARATGGLVWVEHTAVGNMLEERYGIPYFGRKGRTRDGRSILHHTGPAAVSQKAVSYGFNLQYKWHQNLLLNVTPLGLRYEQLMGRTHRQLQPENVVFFTLLVTVAEQLEGFVQAQADALYEQQTTGQSQKLCLADVTQTGALSA